ncbi:MAG: peptide ABC transporter substrate-binding protein [Pseudomonadota bacterium]|nr:peptide ABC transporter substrate-binding protein [Pseudomonadota bacterium]
MTLKLASLKATALVVCGMLLLAGCGGGGGQETQVEEGIRLGVFHMGNASEPQGLDPHIVSGVPEHYIISAIFEGLTTKNPSTLEIEPGVAESWDISDDGRTYTFHLRNDAKWSNGDPVTAEDFRWSWQRALTPELGSVYNYMFFPIVNAEAFATGATDDFSQVGVEVLDDYTLRVQLREPTPYFLQVLDHYSTFPVHRATIEAFGSPTDRLSQWARAGSLVSNGPFKLTEWRVNSHVRVEKADTYWGADKVRLNAIVYYPTENQTTEERMFRDGQLHHTYEVPIEKVAAYRRDEPNSIVVAPYLGSYYYMVNTKRPPFDDVRVRKALALSIDRELLVETVLQGFFEPAYALVPPGTLGYEPPSTFEYDPEQARQLLAEAGYPDGQGFPAFDILYNTNEQHQKVAVAIQQMWRQQLGIAVNLTNQEWQVYLNSQEIMDYDVARRGWIGDYVDPTSFLEMFISNGGNNKTGFSDPRYDEIIMRDAPATQDRDARYALYQEAESILIDTMPILPIYTYQSKHLRHPSVKGMPPNIMDYYNWRYVYLEGSDAGK